MERSAETYWGRFRVVTDEPARGGGLNIMFRALDSSARVSNFQLPSSNFAEIALETVLHADAWRNAELLEVDLTLDNGEVVTLEIRRSN